MRNKDGIASDIIRINEVEVTYVEADEESRTETVAALENVSCSLRNDTVSQGKVLAFAKSQSDGSVTFCFSEDEKKSKEFNEMYYLQDVGAEIEAETNGTSLFYNDPELAGYDDKYETLIQPCATPDIYNGLVLFLGGRQNSSLEL